MEKDLINKLQTVFEDTKQEKEGTDFWFARDLQKLLEYKEWRNFLLVIEKAKNACEGSEQKVSNHFVDVNKMVTVGSDSKREIKDIMLSRYACYLIAQNGDPRKHTIAFAQTYFAVQTRSIKKSLCKYNKKGYFFKRIFSFVIARKSRYNF